MWAPYLVIVGQVQETRRTTFLPYKAIAAIPHDKGLGYTCDSYHGGVSFALHSEMICFDREIFEVEFRFLATLDE